MASFVVYRNMIFINIVSDNLRNFIISFVSNIAFFKRNDIMAFCTIKTKLCLAFSYGNRKLHFVSIVVWVFHTFHIKHLNIFKAGYSFKHVLNSFMLEEKLFFIIKMLKCTAAALFGTTAHRLSSVRRFFDNFNTFSKAEILFNLSYFNFSLFPRKNTRNKHSKAFNFAYAFPACAKVKNINYVVFSFNYCLFHIFSSIILKFCFSDISLKHFVVAYPAALCTVSRNCFFHSLNLCIHIVGTVKNKCLNCFWKLR